ncbi:hypothetical protein WA026_018441 [Henosepilachna vigintioctopunctata]|uniref:Myosin light chain kinase, smooth muscle n=1 Tax=Henosepilachna vigintioctopunctata TaxID=420089 RepID=A0AAW1UUG0_9CUCU
MEVLGNEEDCFARRMQEVAMEEPAILLRGPKDITALVGDRVLLKATYMGHPEPNIRWTRAGRELKNDEKTSITFGGGVTCLLLQDITADDSGKYDVCVENYYGSDCSFASVSVEGPPDPPSGKPSITATMDSVTVAWSSSPYDGGKIVTGYAVEYSLVGSDVWTTVTENCHSLSHTFGGLQPGGRYVFRVRAQNVHGYSWPGLESDVLQLDELNEISTFEPRMVALEPGPEFKARYDILEELGKGKYGIVHKVVDKTTSQKLAAKFIRCRTAKDRDKVQDEIEIMNQLRHQKLLQLAAAFENPREMIMVMEYISGGELFERVVADDFTLTEKDCILFVRQICEGVAYMHSQNVVHLDLKPENIMCHTRTSHEIKIIDFGLAQKLDPDKPTRVLFGTPEFIPPEIINYEPIGLKSDIWSIGVICYVLLSGLSPFMGDNDAETFANITRADYDFDDEAFNTVSQNARDFIAALLINRKEDRLSAEQCLKHTWLDPENHQETVILCTDKLKKFIIRRKWQKTGNAIRALGRMATLSASRRNSANNSTPTTPRQSLTGNNVNSMVMSRMSSLNEENMFNDEINSFHSLTIADTVEEVDQYEEETDNIIAEVEITNPSEEETIPEGLSGDGVEILENDITIDLPNDEMGYQVMKGEERETREDPEATNEIVETVTPYEYERKLINQHDSSKSVKMRSCTERSDSGISCSSHLTSSSCTSTPLLGKKFSINEEPEYRGSTLADSNESLNFNSSKLLTLSSKFESRENLTNKQKDFYSSDDNLRHAVRCKNVNVKLEDKIETFENGKSSSSSSSIKKIPMYSTYSSRTVANAIKKFDRPETTESAIVKQNNSPRLMEKLENQSSFPCSKIEQTNKPSVKLCINELNRSRSRSPSHKHNMTDKTPPKISVDIKTSVRTPSKSAPSDISPRIEKIVSDEHKKCSDRIEIVKPVGYRSPSPSLLRKTQAVIAKEQTNDRYLSKNANNDLRNGVNGTKISPKVNSTTPRTDKLHSEKFQRVAAFWNSAPKT